MLNAFMSLRHWQEAHKLPCFRRVVIEMSSRIGAAQIAAELKRDMSLLTDPASLDVLLGMAYSGTIAGVNFTITVPDVRSGKDRRKRVEYSGGRRSWVSPGKVPSQFHPHTMDRRK